MKRLFACTLMLFATAPSLAADANGYTAKYECRAGGQYCDVDINQLTNRSCDQIISVSTPWSSINWSNNTICLEAGDHSSKGTLTLSASGTASSPKVLRYHRTGDNDDEPWNQSINNRAALEKLIINGKNYWIVHRLSFQNDVSNTPQLHIYNSSNVIVNRSYFTNMDTAAVVFERGVSTTDANTIQNSVVRDGQLKRNFDVMGIDICNATNTRIVSNEIRNPGSHHVQISECGGGVQGTIIENNDLYFSSDVYTNCNGSYTRSGACAGGEAIVSLKDSGTSSNPVKVVQNRIWGARYNDMNVCCTGASGSAISPVGGGNTDSRWYLFQNNIISDSQNAFEWTTWNGGSAINHSVIGNLIHDIRAFRNSTTSSAFWWGGSGDVTKTEFYFNTVVDADSLFSMGNNSELDIRSNVTINANTINVSPGSGTLAAYNAYFSSGGLNTSSSSNDIIRSTAAESFNQAYCYMRKLRTTPEQVCVQNVKPTSQSPHARAGDPVIGSRSGIGISDSLVF